MTQRIRGVLSPVVTPFKADLSPDSQRFTAHCRWLLSQNCGLAVFGTNSEANSLAADERMSLLDALAAAGLDTTRMMPGTGCCSITETVKLTSHAVRHGCAGVLMLPPFYYKGVSEEGLYRHFSEVVQRVGDSRLRIYLYHIHRSRSSASRGTRRAPAQAYPDAIAGMKDSSGDWNNTKSSSTALRNGIRRLRGLGIVLLANMRNGGVGTISATANVNPPRSTSSTPNGATPCRCAAGQLNITRDAFGKKYLMIGALKRESRSTLVIPRGQIRPPLVELTAGQAQSLAAELKQIGFTWD